MSFTPIETQEQLDAVLKERLERAERKAAGLITSQNDTAPKQEGPGEGRRHV